jgi:hypothetical protein
MNTLIVKVKDFVKVTSFGRFIMRLRRNIRGKSKSNAINVMHSFLGTELDKSHEKVILNDMIECSKKYKFSYPEYFLFNIESKSDKERSTFISDSERVDICEKLNTGKNQHIFDDKGKTAELFSAYYKRETLAFRTKKDAERLEAFLKRHKNAIVKPISSACGQGIMLLNGKSNIGASELVTRFCTGLSGGGIIEELIVQDEYMMALHPQSVNTVRIATIRMENRVVIFHPFFRVGRGESVVDNAGAGGIICAVDDKTGTVIAAKDEKGHKYELHPDTQLPLIGFKLPEWQDAIDLAKELAMIVPSNRYTGWDLAHTNSGWVLVEGNARGQFLAQIPLERGFKEEVTSYLKELGIE